MVGQRISVTEQSAPVAKQSVSDETVGEKEAAEMFSRDCKRRARMKPPPPTAATMRTRRIIDTMTGT